MPHIVNAEETIHYNYIPSIYNDNPEVIVLIHGLGLDSSSWDDMIPYLKDFTILVYDIRGHGLSSHNPNEEITWELLCDNLTKLLDYLHIQDFHLIGYGLGGNIGIKFALTHPGLLQSLTLISTTSYYPIEISIKLAEDRKKLVKQKSIQELAHALAHNICYQPSELKVNQLVNSFTKVPMPIYFDFVDLIIHTVSLDELQNVMTPTLVLTGEFDPIYSTYLFSMTASYLSKSRFLIIPNASNAVHIDQPEVVATWFKDFIFNLTKKGDWNTSLVEQRIHIQEIITKGKINIQSFNQLHVDLMGPFRVQVNGNEI